MPNRALDEGDDHKQDGHRTTALFPKKIPFVFGMNCIDVRNPQFVFDRDDVVILLAGFKRRDRERGNEMTELREENQRRIDGRTNAETAMIRVAVIDVEPFSREFTVGVIDKQPDLTVVGTGVSGSEAVQLAKDLRPEVMMIDLALSDADNDSITRSIIETGRLHPAVLVVTDDGDEEAALSAIRAGASGVCSKIDPPGVVLDSVRSVAAGHVALSPPVLRKIFRRLFPGHPDELSACSCREVEVLGLVAEGATNPEIGERLFISQTTVRSHVQSLRQKLGVRNRIGLVVFAHRAGLAGPTAANGNANGTVPKNGTAPKKDSVLKHTIEYKHSNGHENVNGPNTGIEVEAMDTNR